MRIRSALRPGGSLLLEILDEQRRTRLLLERLVTRIERQGLTENLGKKGYSA
mgnify:CR=1 FL=1